MELTLHHTTEYRYAEPASRVIQALRLWPAACAGQQVRRWQVSVNGRFLNPSATDGYANPVATSQLDGPVSVVRIEVNGVVTTHDTFGVLQGSAEPLPPEFFLYDTPLTQPDAAIRALVAEFDTPGDMVARLHALSHRVRDRVDYVPAQTDVATTAAEALASGAGVCQDHAHLLAACARSLGFPARYVSGYLCADGDGRAAASHAWTEVYVPALGWVGFDAANRLCPDERYVRIACGRDYRDAAPVRGMRHGGDTETLEVSVRIGQTQVAQ